MGKKDARSLGGGPKSKSKSAYPERHYGVPAVDLWRRQSSRSRCQCSSPEVDEHEPPKRTCCGTAPSVGTWW